MDKTTLKIEDLKVGDRVEYRFSTRAEWTEQKVTRIRWHGCVDLDGVCTVTQPTIDEGRLRRAKPKYVLGETVETKIDPYPNYGQWRKGVVVMVPGHSGDIYHVKLDGCVVAFSEREMRPVLATVEVTNEKYEALRKEYEAYKATVAAANEVNTVWRTLAAKRETDLLNERTQLRRDLEQARRDQMTERDHADKAVRELANVRADLQRMHGEIDALRRGLTEAKEELAGALTALHNARAKIVAMYRERVMAMNRETPSAARISDAMIAARDPAKYPAWQGHRVLRLAEWNAGSPKLAEVEWDAYLDFATRVAKELAK